MPNIFAANSSTLLLDGVAIEGLQSLSFRVVTEREDVRAVGTHERVDVSFGLRTVHGELSIKSHSAGLDKHLDERSRFQLVANLKKDKGLVDQATRTISFDDCFAEAKTLRLDAGGVALTVYSFTATRVREE